MALICQSDSTDRIPRSRSPSAEADTSLRCMRARLVDGWCERREFTPSLELQSAGTDTGRLTGRVRLPRPRSAAGKRSGRSVIGIAIADAGGVGSDTSEAGLSLA